MMTPSLCMRAVRLMVEPISWTELGASVQFSYHVDIIATMHL